ncbi:MAG: CopD family protein [Gammaproteobacteria bacterium]|jgi:uncharacterized membrane protein|nr:CopD family protein [Gammaproteobacteria bacterium]
MRNWLYLGHVLATVVWVGGMFFAYQCLRPVAASQLDGPTRLRLWNGVFAQFFPWVWLSVVTLLGTGHSVIAWMGGFAAVPVHVHAMTTVGYVMTAVFLYLFFVPYRRLQAAVAGQDWAAGGLALTRIRQLVGFNLLLGLANIAGVFLLPLLG